MRIHVRKEGKYKLTIDPGLSGTGWGMWTPDWVLFQNGVITPPKQIEDWQAKAAYIVTELAPIYRKNMEVFVEYPMMFQSAGGRVTASSGALVKLTTLVGMIMNAYKARPVKVNEWKGQLPKDVVKKRILKLLPDCKAKSHDFDAIGIGLYLAGRF